MKRHEKNHDEADFMTAQRQEVERICVSLGISPETAALVGSQWETGTRREWRGERPYIAATDPDQARQKRRAAVQAFCVEGKPVKEVVETSGVSRATLYRALARKEK